MRPTSNRLKLLTKYYTHESLRDVAYHRKLAQGPMSPPLEGLVAINKPSGMSSADALRKLQVLFKPSKIFAETFEAERIRRANESHNQRHRRKNPNATRLEVKIGHGGTLDPMASGVLIAGIGAGTKELSKFLSCTKTYEATALFGAGTATYDAVGKVVKWAGWEGIDREKVETTLEQFRGDILQKPPIYSALHMGGKRLYEYARQGLPLPVEIKARPVTVELLELVDFTFDHEYDFPKEEVEDREKAALDAHNKLAVVNPIDKGAKRGRSRSRSPEDEKSKKQKRKAGSALTAGILAATDATEALPQSNPSLRPEGKPPIVKLRMTVSSGFYVRSLIHDLGEALGSAAHMVKLVRTRQQSFEIGKDNVIEWEDLMEHPEEVWGPKVEGVLRTWAAEKHIPKA